MCFIRTAEHGCLFRRLQRKKKKKEEEKMKKLNPDLWVQFFFVMPLFESKHNFLHSFMRLIAFPPNTHLERFHQNLGALTSFFGRNTQSQITSPRQVEMLVPRKMWCRFLEVEMYSCQSQDTTQENALFKESFARYIMGAQQWGSHALPPLPMLLCVMQNVNEFMTLGWSWRDSA